LFAQAQKAYENVNRNFSFLNYQTQSIKPSIYSYLGNYFGFQGYYNPFSGEAQVNTTVPSLLQPYIATHEMAHQLGYAKENEANFVGYLACKNYSSNIFRYSTYYDMFNYTIGQLYVVDSSLAKKYLEQRSQQFKKDVLEVRKFFSRYHTSIEDFIMNGYAAFLKMNKQPQGLRSYNEVVTWLIAYYKKFGVGSL